MRDCIARTVAEIVKQIGGYVWAESKPGHGSAFTVLLPLTNEQKEEAAAQAQVPDRQALQGLKVALVNLNAIVSVAALCSPP